MSEEIQNALREVQFRNDDRILICATDVWPENGPRLEDVPEWQIPNAVVGFAPDGRVIDIVSKTGKPIRWWMVVGYCRTHGKNHLPLVYDGEGASAPVGLLERGKYVAMRRASEGPWLLISTPEIRERRKTNDAVAAAVKDALAKREKEKQNDDT